MGGLLMGLLLMWVLMGNGKPSVPIEPATHRVLTMLSGKTNRSEEDLLREALRDLYAKYRKQESA
jgi:hypothetical protein